MLKMDKMIGAVFFTAFILFTIVTISLGEVEIFAKVMFIILGTFTALILGTVIVATFLDGWHEWRNKNGR